MKLLKAFSALLCALALGVSAIPAVGPNSELETRRQPASSTLRYRQAMAANPRMHPGHLYVFQLHTSPYNDHGTTAYKTVALVAGSVTDEPRTPKDFVAKIYEFEMDTKAVPWVIRPFTRNGWLKPPNPQLVQHLRYVTFTSMTRTAIQRPGERGPKSRKEYNNPDNNCHQYVRNLIAKIMTHNNNHHMRTHTNQPPRNRQNRRTQPHRNKQTQASGDQQTASLWHAANRPNQRTQAPSIPQPQAPPNKQAQQAPRKREAHKTQRAYSDSKLQTRMATTPNYDHANAVQPGMVPGTRYAFTLKWPLGPGLSGDKDAFTKAIGFTHIGIVVGSVVEKQGKPTDFVATLYEFIERRTQPGKVHSGGVALSGKEVDPKEGPKEQQLLTEAAHRKWRYRPNDPRTLEFVTETTMEHVAIQGAGEAWAKDRKVFSVAANNCVAYVDHLLPMIKAAAPGKVGSEKTAGLGGAPAIGPRGNAARA